MTEKFIITDEMRKKEAERWKEKVRAFKCGIRNELRDDKSIKFKNHDIPSPLTAFTGSEAAEAALDATEDN